MFKKIILGKVDLSNVSHDYCWYTLVTQFNYEEKCIENIQEAVHNTDLEELIEDYYIPIKYTKETVTLADGTTKDKVHKVKGAFSNYIFIKCILTEKLWNLLRTTTGIAVIPTVGGVPTCVQDYEIQDMKDAQKPEGFTFEELKELEKKEYEKYHRFTMKGNGNETVVCN